MTDHTDETDEQRDEHTEAPSTDGGVPVQPGVRRPSPRVEAGELPSAETDGDGTRHVRPDGEGADLQRIPEALRRRDQWLLWDADNDTPRRPHWRGDFGISWSDPDAWRSFEAARDAAAERESWGVGYVTAAENDDHVPGCYGVIDLDGCLDDDGRLAEWVPDLTPFVERGAYVERSPSEAGLHVPVALGSAPEWWTDTHVSADEHEGVEVLANKFCTFTGDAVEGAGDEVVQMDEWLAEWLADAYERINGEDPRSGGDSGGGREARPTADGRGAADHAARERPDSADTGADDEWLTDEHVADALDALDPDMAHDEWVRIGFAVHDYDDGADGRRLFTEWSKRGSKWDDDAERKAEHIWSKATPGDRPSNVSVATLVDRAKRAGWQPPAAAGDAGDVVAEVDAGGARFNGPPEPVVRDDGTLGVVRPTGDGASVREVALGTWRCRNCEATDTETVAADNDKSDLAAPGDCPGCEEPSFTHVGLGADDLQTALRADRIWRPASGVTTAGFGEMFDDVREHIRTYWDAGDDETADAVYAGLTAYALSTWVRENLTFVPHGLTLGRTTGGKTRLLNTLARVSYRAHVAADATPASMFRLIDDYDVTYLVSEYHGLAPETRSGIDAILRAGQKRGEYVDRAEQTATGYEPGVFDPFTHIVVATQYDVDDDIKNRCIRTRSSGHHREMPATFDEAQAAALRDRLLGARFRLLDSDEWRDAEAHAYEYLAESGIDGRTREKLLSLVACALVWNRLDDDLAAFVDLVVEQDRGDAADSEDAQFVEAVRDLAFEAIADGAVNVNMDAAAAAATGDPFAGVTIPYSAVCERYEEMTGEEKHPTWVGHVRKRLGLDKERKRDGTVITDDDLGETLRTLCEDLGLDWTRTPRHEPIVELPGGSEEPSDNGCSECGRDRPLTHRWKGRNRRLCTECAEDIRGGRGATPSDADEPVTVADEHATLDEHEN